MDTQRPHTPPNPQKKIQVHYFAFPLPSLPYPNTSSLSKSQSGAVRFVCLVNVGLSVCMSGAVSSVCLLPHQPPTPNNLLDGFVADYAVREAVVCP